MGTARSEELRLLKRATLMSQWRWATERKRLRRRGPVTPFALHDGERRTRHIVWRELRRDAGMPSDEPPAWVWRIALDLAARKFRRFLREHPL